MKAPAGSIFMSDRWISESFSGSCIAGAKSMIQSPSQAPAVNNRRVWQLSAGSLLSCHRSKTHEWTASPTSRVESRAMEMLARHEKRLESFLIPQTLFFEFSFAGVWWIKEDSITDSLSVAHGMWNRLDVVCWRFPCKGLLLT